MHLVYVTKSVLETTLPRPTTAAAKNARDPRYKFDATSTAGRPSSRYLLHGDWGALARTLFLDTPASPVKYRCTKDSSSTKLSKDNTPPPPPPRRNTWATCTSCNLPPCSLWPPCFPWQASGEKLGQNAFCFLTQTYQVLFYTYLFLRPKQGSVGKKKLVGVGVDNAWYRTTAGTSQLQLCYEKQNGDPENARC